MNYDERMLKLLNAVQEKMPKEVNDWVLKNNIQWILNRSYYTDYASCLPIEKDDKDKFIIEAYPNMFRLKFKLQMAVLAHEIAHAFLGHKISNKLYDIKQENLDEREANRLANSWGFDMETLSRICNKNYKDCHYKKNLRIRKIAY